MPHKYETKKKKSQGPMKNETLDLLLDFFAEPNRKLAKMLNDSRFLWSDYKRRYKTLSRSPIHDSNHLLQQARIRAAHSAKGQSHLPFYRNMPKHQIMDRVHQEKMKRWQEIKRQQTKRMRDKQEAEIMRVRTDHEHLQQARLVGMNAFFEQKKRIQELLEQKKQEIAMLQSLEAGNISARLGFQNTKHLQRYFEGNGESPGSSQQKIKYRNVVPPQENRLDSSNTQENRLDSSKTQENRLDSSNTQESRLDSSKTANHSLSIGQNSTYSSIEKSSFQFHQGSDRRNDTNDQQKLSINNARDITLINSSSLNKTLANLRASSLNETSVNLKASNLSETLANIRRDVNSLKAQKKYRGEAVELIGKKEQVQSKNTPRGKSENMHKKKVKKRRKKRSRFIV